MSSQHCKPLAARQIMLHTNPTRVVLIQQPCCCNSPPERPSSLKQQESPFLKARLPQCGFGWCQAGGHSQGLLQRQGCWPRCDVMQTAQVLCFSGTCYNGKGASHLDAASGWWSEALDVVGSCSLLVTDMAAPPATTAALAAPILAAICLIRLPPIACCCCITPAIVGTTLQATGNGMCAR